jgi:hypothetical protein
VPVRSWFKNLWGVSRTSFFCRKTTD